jgi:hypothetical protein
MSTTAFSDNDIENYIRGGMLYVPKQRIARPPAHHGWAAGVRLSTAVITTRVLHPTGARNARVPDEARTVRNIWKFNAPRFLRMKWNKA